MPFTIPNESDSNTNIGRVDQAEVDTGDIAMLTAGIAGDGVLSGCQVTAQPTPDLTVDVASGTVQIAGSVVSVAQGTLEVVPDSSFPRFDLIAVSAAGVKQVLTGTAAAEPVFPAVPSSRVVLAAVFVGPAVGAVTQAAIVDKRVTVVQPFTQADADALYLTAAQGDAAYVLLDDARLTDSRVGKVGNIRLIDAGGGTHEVTGDDDMVLVQDATDLHLSTDVPVGKVIEIQAAYGVTQSGPSMHYTITGTPTPAILGVDEGAIVGSGGLDYTGGGNSATFTVTVTGTPTPVTLDQDYTPLGSLAFAVLNQLAGGTNAVPSGSAGSGAPDNGAGSDGDIYADLDNTFGTTPWFWRKTAGEWALGPVQFASPYGSNAAAFYTVATGAAATLQLSALSEGGVATGFANAGPAAGTSGDSERYVDGIGGPSWDDALPQDQRSCAVWFDPSGNWRYHGRRWQPANTVRAALRNNVGLGFFDESHTEDFEKTADAFIRATQGRAYAITGSGGTATVTIAALEQVDSFALGTLYQVFGRAFVEATSLGEPGTVNIPGMAGTNEEPGGELLVYSDGSDTVTVHPSAGDVLPGTGDYTIASGSPSFTRFVRFAGGWYALP